MKISKKKVISLVSVASLSVLTFASISYATIWAGGRSSGANFSAYYDSSVASYGYTNHYDSARADWNSASSSVNITKTTSTSGNPDKYYVGVSSVAGLLGQISRYTSSGQVVTSLSDDWAYATVSIYHNNMDAYGEDGMSQSERISNATHEVGHTLSMAHPVTSRSSVMKQGVQSIGVQSYDKESLIEKWGD
ncbi:hypothetical protein [Paenibacillus jiagnxiensis]|uniref:hypothetical protein n=1 Tax=Paenibacillus jiagnxiensis TaxID=3228926 RepID=UPI0033A0BF74